MAINQKRDKSCRSQDSRTPHSNAKEQTLTTQGDLQKQAWRTKESESQNSHIEKVYVRRAQKQAKLINSMRSQAVGTWGSQWLGGWRGAICCWFSIYVHFVENFKAEHLGYVYALVCMLYFCEKFTWKRLLRQIRIPWAPSFSITTWSPVTSWLFQPLITLHRKQDGIRWINSS